MPTTSHSLRPVKSLRRFVTVVACEIRFTHRDLEKLGVETVGQGIDIVWNILVEKARMNGGLSLPLHGSSANVVFGYPNPDADHAARAIQCARQFVDAAATERSKSLWLPSFGIGIHSADCLILEQGHRTSRSISISGAAPECAALLSHVPRSGEILLTESTLKTFASDLPSGLETIQVQFEQEPDLDGLNWEAVVFLGLPDHLQREALLAGRGVADNPGDAEYFFRYLFSIKVVSARATLNILSLQTAEHATSFLLLAPDARTDNEMTRLGAYTLIKRLGKGGTGQVWLARDFHGNLVALKSLQEAFAGDQRQISRLQREARAMASLPHPNICQVYEVGEADGLHFIAMEYVSGITLADLIWSGSGAFANSGTLAEIILWIRKWQRSHKETEMGSRPRQLPFPETLRMYCKVCEAVALAHENGILHRDLKPGNILLRENGEPVVSDFGLAKLESADTENSLSLHGEILGTLDYMAPEQAHDSKNVDERADIYGLGAILYLLLSGRPHFYPSGDILKDANRLQNHEPKSLRSIVGNLHPDIALIAEKCLRPRARDRYQSARMLRDDLERFLLGQPILARPPSPLRLAKVWTLKHRAIVGTVAAAVCVMVLVAFYSFAQINRKRIEAEGALISAEAAKARAEENEKRAISAMQKSEQDRLRAEAAEFDKKESVTILEQANTKISRLEMQQRAIQEVPMLVAAKGIAGTDLTDPPEPQKKAAPAETGRAYQLSYSRELAAELAATIMEMDSIMNWDPKVTGSPSAVAPQAVSPKLKELFYEILCLAEQLPHVSQTNPGALLLLAKLSALGISSGNPESLLTSSLSLPSDPALQAEAATLLNQMHRNGARNITTASLKASSSAINHQIAAIAEAMPRFPKTFANISLPPDVLMRFVSSHSERSAFDKEPVLVAMRTDNSMPGVIEAPGANDRNIALITELARATGPCPAIDLSCSPATLIPWDLAASCVEFTARRSAATGFSQGTSTAKSFPKKLDLANSSFQAPSSIPMSPALESLNINNCPVPDGGFVGNFHELRELYAAGVPFQSLEKIGLLDKLKILRFSPQLIADQKSIEVLRGMKSLTHIGIDRNDTLLPVHAFWLLYDTEYFKPESRGKWPDIIWKSPSNRLPPLPETALSSPTPLASPDASPVPSTSTNPPALQTHSAEPPDAGKETSGVIIRMNTLFTSVSRSTPPPQILEKLRPIIGEWGTSLNAKNARNPRDPSYVLECAKYNCLLMQGEKTQDLLLNAEKLAVESGNSGLARECRTLQETLQPSDGGGVFISPYGLRRTGIPENIRLAALYENVQELTRNHAKSSGRPFTPSLLCPQARATGW